VTSRCGTGKIPARISRWFREIGLERAAVAAWRHSGDASEDASQMMLIGKAARKCYFGQRCPMIAH
jgi:hypothetical protein